MRPVVGAVDDDRVLGDAQLVERVEEQADVLVVVDHRVVVGRLPAARLAEALGLGVGAQVHVGHVHPDEEGRVGCLLALDEVDASGDRLVVDRLHALLRQRAGVLDPLLADAAEAMLLGGVVLVRRPGVDDAARAEAIPEVGEFVGWRVVRQLRLLLGVQVVEVAEELVEAVHGRQILVQVAEVVLAELPRRVAVRLQQLGDRHVLGLQTDVHARDTDLAQAGAVDALAGDERRATGGAALLAIGVGEAHPLVGDPVDVRRPVTHQPVAVAAEIRDPDVVAPDHENVRLVGARHACVSPISSVSFCRRSQDGSPEASSLLGDSDCHCRPICRSIAGYTIRCRNGLIAAMYAAPKRPFGFA